MGGMVGWVDRAMLFVDSYGLWRLMVYAAAVS